MSTFEIKELAAKLDNAVKDFEDAHDAAGVKSRVAIRGAARQLLLATMTPDEFCLDQILHMTQIVALRLCMKLGIFTAIPENGSISATDLAEAVNCTVSLVERLCRILAVVGFLGHIDSGSSEYCHTKFSLAWRGINAPSAGTFFYAAYDVYLKPAIPIFEYLETRKCNGLFADPSSNWGSPVAAYYGRPDHKQGTWEALANFPDITHTFQTPLGVVDALVPPTGLFDFGKLANEDDRVQLVDIAGGYGGVLTKILDAHPRLDPSKCVLQDIEVTITFANSVRDRGVKTQVIDFHKRQPVIGARAYFMRFITHDYSDLGAIVVLSHVAEAMAEDSRLLIADAVMPERLGEET